MCVLETTEQNDSGEEQNEKTRKKGEKISEGSKAGGSEQNQYVEKSSDGEKNKNGLQQLAKKRQRII